jgi:hypothetical protein
LLSNAVDVFNGVQKHLRVEAEHLKVCVFIEVFCFILEVLHNFACRIPQFLSETFLKLDKTCVELAKTVEMLD